MDDVLLWFTANRDTVIVGVVVGIVIASARWGAAIVRRGSGLVRQRINDRRCKKAEEARQEQEAAERKEQEAQRKAEQLRWRERSLNEARTLGAWLQGRSVIHYDIGMFATIPATCGYTTIPAGTSTTIEGGRPHFIERD